MPLHLDFSTASKSCRVLWYQRTAFDMMYRSHKIQSISLFFYKKGIALPSSLATDSAFAIGISAGAAANAGSTTGSSICGAGA